MCCEPSRDSVALAHNARASYVRGDVQLVLITKYVDVNLIDVEAKRRFYTKTHEFSKTYREM